MNSYPSRFPAPDNDGMTGDIGVGVQRTSIPVALANQETRFNSPRVEMSLTFSMDNDTLLDWINWAFGYAHKWFLMDLVSPHGPVDIVSEHRVRMIGEVQQVKRGDNWNSVTMPVEILPGDREDADVPAPTYNWSIAGTPASPSTDWSLSGTPDTPSTDRSIAHLYYY